MLIASFLFFIVKEHGHASALLRQNLPPCTVLRDRMSFSVITKYPQ
jgi:hypothetical protein